MLDMAYEAIIYSIKKQNTDGSWFYGENYHHKFIDCFHTGYNLEAIQLANAIYHDSLFEQSIDKGYKYFAKNFITNNYQIKYLNSSLYPIDTHNYSQAIITLLKFSKTNKDVKIVNKIIDSFLGNLYDDKNKYFYYQINKIYKNKINYLRWCQGWAYYAIVFYLNFVSNNKLNEKN